MTIAAGLLIMAKMARLACPRVLQRILWCVTMPVMAYQGWP